MTLWNIPEYFRKKKYLNKRCTTRKVKGVGHFALAHYYYLELFGVQ